MSRVIEWNPLLSSFAGLTGESRRLLDSPVKPASDEGTGSGQAGFTLIEMIVALAVLSLGLVALLNVTGENVRAAGTIRETMVGQIVAENHLVEAMLRSLRELLFTMDGETTAAVVEVEGVAEGDEMVSLLVSEDA